MELSRSKRSGLAIAMEYKVVSIVVERSGRVSIVKLTMGTVETDSTVKHPQ
jgi:hypothetical protein